MGNLDIQFMFNFRKFQRKTIKEIGVNENMGQRDNLAALLVNISYHIFTKKEFNLFSMNYSCQHCYNKTREEERINGILYIIYKYEFK